MKILSAIIISLNFIPLSAQDSLCTSKLRNATDLFDAGQIEQIPSLLYPCLADGFTKEERIKAYKLLINSYLFDYNREEAEKTMRNFLNEFPRYKIQSSDPMEFNELLRSFSISGAWEIGITGGINFSSINSIKHFETVPDLKTSYHSRAGLDIGAAINRYVTEIFRISAEINYSMINYYRTGFSGDVGFKSSYTESTGWMSIPLTLSIDLIRNHKWTPYAFAGYELAYLFSAKSKLQIQYLSGEFSDEPGNLNVIKSRKQIGSWLCAGMGMAFKFGGNQLRFTVGFDYNTTPFVKVSNRFNRDNFADESFKLNRYICSVNFTKTLYKISKKN